MALSPGSSSREVLPLSTSPEASTAEFPAGRRRVRAYVSLTKPRILELLLMTTVPTMFLAAGGVPDLMLVVAVIVGGSLSAASAGVFNMIIDRDLDAVMSRTRHRPLVTGEVPVGHARIMAWTLAVAQAVWLLCAAGPLPALFSTAGLLWYVLIYTIVLKRRTAQNIVWGGLAGCTPILVGWTAVTGEVGLPALVLVALLFLWTPPHYWPLSMHYAADYRRVGVPMLGAIRTPAHVANQVIVYAWATLACALVLTPVAGMGPVYTATALAGGGGFVISAHLLRRRIRRGKPLRPLLVFRASIIALIVVFIAVGADTLLR